MVSIIVGEGKYRGGERNGREMRQEEGQGGEDGRRTRRGGRKGSQVGRKNIFSGLTET